MILPKGVPIENPEILLDFGVCGAGNVTRTHDLLITNQLLYRLSYTSIRDLQRMRV